MKQIAILGSTGSIGESTLRVIRHLGPEEFRVVALAAHSHIDTLEKQADEFHPELLAVYDPEKAAVLKKRRPEFHIVSGMEGVEAAASYSSASFVVSALSGTLGLIPTIAAIKAGKTIGLANKESLVSGGAFVMTLARKHQVTLLPIDSEHSAIFQCLHGEKIEAVRRLIITASGGPFYHLSKEQLAHVDVDQALRHPKWVMGPKITVDSSTLMNKGLEVIEAHWLFDMPCEKIEVVVHPQSVIHSLVEYEDGSLIAQMSEPSMLIPIQYALTYPERKKGLLSPFDFFKNEVLQFSKPDLDKFPCLRLAFQAIEQGGSAACYMNAANEVLVHRFLKKNISWMEIAEKLENLMSSHQTVNLNSLDDILAVDKEARQQAALI